MGSFYDQEKDTGPIGDVVHLEGYLERNGHNRQPIVDGDGFDMMDRPDDELDRELREAEKAYFPSNLDSKKVSKYSYAVLGAIGAGILVSQLIEKV